MTRSATSCCIFITRCASWLATVIGYVRMVCGILRVSSMAVTAAPTSSRTPYGAVAMATTPTVGLIDPACQYPGNMPPTINMGIPGASSSVTGGVTGKRVLLAEPRGYCAGVDRAVETVERALEKHGAPVYVRHEIVHNVHVVETLAKAGAIFVEETDEVPEGSIVVFSAHGVAPTVHVEAAAAQSRAPSTPPARWSPRCTTRPSASPATTTTSCSSATTGHEEVVGTAGEAPDHVQVVDNPDAVDKVTVRDPNKVIWLSQTTLSVDETMETVRRLREKFPDAAGSAQRRHLLRHPEPSGRGQGDGAGVRAGDRRRVDATRRTRCGWSRSR